MNRKIAWRSVALDEIELVYEKAEQDQTIGTLLEQLELQALEEARNNVGMLKTRNGDILKPEQFDGFSDADKETVINILGSFGLAALDTDMENATIIIKLSPVITLVQACTIFNILNRVEKLDGSITIIKPKWTLHLLVPLGGRKGLGQWEMLLLLLYPWLSIKEESTKEPAIIKGEETSDKSPKLPPENPCAEEKPAVKAEKKSFWKKLFG